MCSLMTSMKNCVSRFSRTKCIALNVRFCTTVDYAPDSEEFDKLGLMPSFYTKKPYEQKRERFTRPPIPPRYKRMPVNQDWNSVWPSQRMFSPSVVPLPLYMGRVYDDDGPVTVGRYLPRPSKFANPELMKIPNFLHLAPPTIKKHCEALKKFCTKWPETLKTDEDCDKHFPVEVITSDYCHASPNIRDERARNITIKLKLSSLDLDYHAKDKLKRILNDRYDKNTDLITITADRCPLKGQNIDYAKYLLTACYFESWKTEAWEADKEQSDWESFFWDKSLSKQNLVSYLKNLSPDIKEEEILEKPEVKSYSQTVSNLFDKQENDALWEEYKGSVEKLLFAQ
ncbi:28S ribosomal protein S35-like protein [Leptotrombidium deliense]|uniref:28S ribosomal protein S35-like protein n=1 Tax=Leptotrombidium deliense TaxID=299467 RepID=A0A443SJ01_9ACAR|nr:28S ribosomal protein S35-like protein [Leptotrombidium deliense]